MKFSVLFQNFQYLEKWQGFDNANCTWEPKHHLPDHVISNYVPTQVGEHRLKHFSAAFERAVYGRLKSKNPVLSVFVELDVFRYIFGDVSTKLCDLNDFKSLNLSENWYYNLNSDGTGKKIKFPIKVSARLTMRKIYVKNEDKLVQKTLPIEKCRVYSCTRVRKTRVLNHKTQPSGF